VIGLDGHPAQTQWELNVHPDIETSAVLDPEERALWRRFERGLLTVGVGDATRPFTSSKYFDREGSEAFFAALRDRFGEDFRTAITAASVEKETKDILRDVGIENPETMHYGEEKSRNDFAGEDICALNGCIDPGDDFVLNLLAERGLDATPERSDVDCEDCDGDGCHECNWTGKKRAHGRGFVGPDADAANEILASVREQHIAQGAGRAARDADNPEDRAIVFIRTDAAPPGFLDMRVPGVEWLATDTQTEIIETLTQHSSATTREIAEAVGCSKEHARNTLGRLEEENLVDVRENAGDHGAHLYRILAGIGTTVNAQVDLTPDTGSDTNETTNDAVCSLNTWSLAIESVHPSGSVMNTGTSTDTHADQSQPPGEITTATPPPD
jgi:DNA-binding transcriptional ArsR family regulator